jgi:hypothetical protein
VEVVKEVHVRGNEQCQREEHTWGFMHAVGIRGYVVT